MKLNNFAHINSFINIPLSTMVDIDVAMKKLLMEIEDGSQSGYFKSIDSYRLEEVKNRYEKFKKAIDENGLVSYAFREHQRLSSSEYLFSPDYDEKDSLLALDGKLNSIRSCEVTLSMHLSELIAVLEITNEYLNEESRREMIHKRDTWHPPENFKDGTDDEQEIWETYNKK